MLTVRVDVDTHYLPLDSDVFQILFGSIQVLLKILGPQNGWFQSLSVVYQIL